MAYFLGPPCITVKKLQITKRQRVCFFLEYGADYKMQTTVRFARMYSVSSAWWIMTF